MRNLEALRAIPPIVWACAFVLFAGSCALALPWLGAQFDFHRDGAIQVHVTDRALMPLLIAENGPGNMLLLAAYFVCYGIAFIAYERVLRTLDVRFAAAAFGIGAIAAIALPILPTSDPYAYALYGLEGGPLGLNPYVAHPSGITGPWSSTLLALFPNAAAPVRVCYYGPFFALVYAALASLLQHGSLLGFLIAERVLGVVAVIVTALGLAFAIPEESRSLRAGRAFAFALQPLVVFEFVAFAHGDILMLAALAWAYAAWRRERMTFAGALCGVAVCTRIVALVAFAALLVALVRRDRAGALRAIGGFAASVVVLGAFSFLRFHATSLGGQPVFFSWTSAPLIVLAAVFGPASHPALGLYLEEILGASLIVALLYRVLRGAAPSSLAWLPIATLAGVPGLYAHYIAWASPLQSVSRDARFLRVFRMLSLVAPLLSIVHLDPFAAPGAPVVVQLLVLVAVWVPVLLAFREPATRRATTNS
jgi:hypothetical protein